MLAEVGAAVAAGLLQLVVMFFSVLQLVVIEVDYNLLVVVFSAGSNSLW